MSGSLPSFAKGTCPEQREGGQVLKSKGFRPPVPTKSFVLIMRLFLLSIRGKESIMSYIIFCDGVKNLSHAIGGEAVYDSGVQ